MGLPCAEEDRDPLRIPTRYNIMSALYWLIQGQQAGDSLVFHYSGQAPGLPVSTHQKLD